MLDKDQNLKEKLTRLFDRTTYEAMALMLAQPDPEIAQAEPVLDWMTATQLARYWQLINAEGDPTTAGIMKWTKRSDDEHPLPHACMGDLCDSSAKKLIAGLKKKLRAARQKAIARNFNSRVSDICKLITAVARVSRIVAGKLAVTPIRLLDRMAASL